MELSDDDVRHVARLARLAMPDHEVAAHRGQLSVILDYAAAVGEVAADDVPPTTHPFGLRNVSRADEPVEPWTQDRSLSTAPAPQDGRFRVPPILSEEGHA